MVQSMDHPESHKEEPLERSHVPMSPSVSPSSPLDLTTHNRNPFDPRSSSPLDLSIKATQNNLRQMSVDDPYEPPEIITQPKTEWHYRSMKDLANKHLPYIAGNGPQRTPIRVAVPPMSHHQLYLGIEVVTKNNDFHESKVIVPAKTKMNTAHVSHNNDLSCLQFDECNPTDLFDVETRQIYLKITPAERQAQCKDVRIHMFNLYQNQLITKDLIEVKQLNLCKISFWLCVYENGQYRTVSSPSFSSLIEEKKMTTRSRTSQPINKPSVISMPYGPYVDDNNNDNTEDDNSY